MEVRQKNLEYRRGAKSHHWKKSWIDWTGRRSDPTRRESLDRAQERPEERDIRAGTEDAEYRSGSDAEKGERLILEVSNGDISH